MKEYIPKPIDTSDIELPLNLQCIAEKIAENVHEVWAEARMAQGWTYGEQRDDKNLKSPCLVAYGDLPEYEKEYDQIYSKVYKTLLKVKHLRLSERKSE